VADQTNILFLHVDNLGFGGLSCYSGGPFRGVTTKRNFKLVLVQQRPHLHTWAAYHLNGIIDAPGERPPRASDSDGSTA
jgi:hypothetical protein